MQQAYLSTIEVHLTTLIETINEHAATFKLALASVSTSTTSPTTSYTRVQLQKLPLEKLRKVATDMGIANTAGIAFAPFLVNKILEKQGK